MRSDYVIGKNIDWFDKLKRCIEIKTIFFIENEFSFKFEL